MFSDKDQRLARLSRDNCYCEDIVILDGISGTGKTMLSPILATLDRMQNPRFEYIFEYISICRKLGHMTDEACEVLLKLHSDVKYYDALISRDVNFRPSDLSGVIANRKFMEYFIQLFLSDRSTRVAPAKSSLKKLFLITHQLLDCAGPLFKAFGARLKIIEIVRHPLLLIDHWLTYVSMFGNNPKDFSVCIRKDAHSPAVPWFAEGWQEDYLKMTDIEIVLKTLHTLMLPVYSELENPKESIYIIPFEGFVLRPNEYLGHLEVFLHTKVTNKTKAVMREQRVPRTSVNSGPKKNIYRLYNAPKSLGCAAFSEVCHDKLSEFKRIFPTDIIEQIESLSEDYMFYFGKHVN